MIMSKVARYSSALYPNRFIWLGALFAVLFWLLDSLIDSIFFAGGPYFENLLPAGMELYMRLLASFMIILLGFIVSKYVETSNRLNRYLEQGMLDRLDQKKCYRVCFENAPIPMITLDANLRIVNWNREAENLFGWRLVEVAGMKIFEAVLPVQGDSGYASIDDYFKRHGKMIAHNLLSNGRSNLYKWEHAPVLDDAGKLIHIVLMGSTLGEAA